MSEFEAFLTDQQGSVGAEEDILDNGYLDLLLLIAVVLVDGHTL